MCKTTKNVVQIGKTRVGRGNSPALMGVLNISPESFFSDSFTPCEQVQTRIEEMRRAGAEIIDLGARSTALHAPPLTVVEERERVISTFRELEDAESETAFSLDTMHPEVLEAALRFNLAAINDIGGLRNPEYAKLAADSGLPVIAMTAGRIPGDPLNFPETLTAMQEICNRADAAGITELILDPGIGIWVAERTVDADWELCRRYDELGRFDCPLLAAVSRKTFIGDVIGKPPQGRLFGTLGVLFYLLEHGADIVRVHDVAAARDIILVYEHLCRRQ